MKKYNTPWTVATAVFVLLITSITFNYKFIHLTSEQRATITNLNYKIDAQKKALELSDDIMDNNEIWDKDGSDLMSDYLKLRKDIDADFMDGFHENALLDSVAYTYNE